MTDRARHTLHEDLVAPSQLKGRSFKLIVGSQRLPSRNINGGVSFFPPHAHAPGHIHQREEEVVFVLEGSGELVADGVAERICPGTFYLIPPGVLHSVNNTGQVTIKLLFLFTPPAAIGDYPDIDPTGTGE